MSKYELKLRYFHECEECNGSWAEHSEVVEAESGELAVKQLSAAVGPDADVELVGEADPSAPVTFSEDWAEREYEEHNPKG